MQGDLVGGIGVVPVIGAGPGEAVPLGDLLVDAAALVEPVEGDSGRGDVVPRYNAVNYLVAAGQRARGDGRDP